MYPWNILGIEPTDDITAVKAAYAALVKQHNPEEKPEKFKEIFAAYKTACESIKSRTGIVISTPRQREETPHAARGKTGKGKKPGELPEYSFESINTELDDPDSELYDTNLYAYIFKKLKMSLKKTGSGSRTAWHILELYDPEDGMTYEHRNFLSKCANLLELETFDEHTAAYIVSFFGVHGRAEKTPGGWKVNVSPFLKSDSGKATPEESNIFRGLFETTSKTSYIMALAALIFIALFIGYFVILIMDSGLV